MTVSYRFWETTSALKLFLWYAAGVFSVIIGSALSPTSLAGPGLDMLAMLIFLLCWPVSLVYSIIRVFKKDEQFVTPLIVQTAVFGALINFGVEAEIMR
jgi:hypothetical protein